MNNASTNRNKFFVLENAKKKTRSIFEVYERIDRVLVLCIDPYNCHQYHNMTIENARKFWTSSLNYDCKRNHEMEKELNAS